MSRTVDVLICKHMPAFGNSQCNGGIDKEMDNVSANSAKIKVKPKILKKYFNFFF